jgi:hypothetical protein
VSTLVSKLLPFSSYSDVQFNRTEVLPQVLQESVACMCIVVPHLTHDSTGQLDENHVEFFFIKPLVPVVFSKQFESRNRKYSMLMMSGLCWLY